MNSREEKILREYIRQNLHDKSLLSEGVADLLKKALESGKSKIENLLGTLESNMDDSLEFRAILKKSGAGDAVSKIDTAGQELKVAIENASSSTPEGKNESRRHRYYSINRRRTRALDEVAIGGFEIVGFALAFLGGVPLVLKAAYKLMGLLGFKNTASKLEVAYEKAHHFEEEVVDYVIPDKALYAVYIAMQEKKNPDDVANLKIYQSGEGGTGGRIGGKPTAVRGKRSGRSEKRAMTLEEFADSDVRKKFEKRVWALVLIPWLYSGLQSLHHLFSGVIGTMEGVATGVKAIEVGTAAAEAAPTIASEIGTAVSALVKAA